MIYLIIIVLLLIYFYSTRNFSYWAQRNIKYVTPLPFFGNHLQPFLGKRNIIAMACDLYKKYPDEKVVGYYRGPTPELIIRDPDIIRDILSVDFASFYPRGLWRDEKLLNNLFHSDGDTWKLLRQRLTPAFTTAKLKNMFLLIIKCTECLERAGKEIMRSGGDCDIRDLMARYSTDVISVCGFGIDMDALNNEDSILRKIGEKIFTRSLTETLLVGVWDVFPEIRKKLYLFNKETENAFSTVITKILEKRNFKPIGRNDFVDLLLDLSSKRIIEGESVEHRLEDGSPKRVQIEMDLNCLIAQIFLFFAAGFETSSSAMSYTLHELAFKPDLQRKIQAEIDNIIFKHGNRLCYDAVAEMTLLDMALKEGMRKMPPLGTLTRVCARKYTIKKLGVTIDPGVRIVIPIQAIHLDEKYYNKPDEFIPERFSAEKINDHLKHVYLPFGDGPRACIGARLAKMQSIAGLAALLHKFSVEPSEKTTYHLQKNQRLFVAQGVIGGVPLRIKQREN